MEDDTEAVRRAIIAETPVADGRAECEALHGKCWTTYEMQAEFSVQGFLAPFVHVVRKADGKDGSLQFQHRPRFYFNWQES